MFHFAIMEHNYGTLGWHGVCAIGVFAGMARATSSVMSNYYVVASGTLYSAPAARRVRRTLAQAIAVADQLGFPYAVQDWGANDYVVAHGAHDGIGRTVYATIKTSAPTTTTTGA